jgi:hypothetical protein
MSLILLLIGCGSCGQTTFQNTGVELTIDGDVTSLDSSGGEICGVRGSWASTFEEELSYWPGTRQVNVAIEPEVGNTLWPWEIGIAFPWDQVRGGNQVSLEEDTLSGSPCFRTEGGCEYGLAMSSGTISFLEIVPRHDPCDPFATLGMDMSWDLEFGEPGSEEYWVTSSGSDLVPVFIDFMCANP